MRRSILFRADEMLNDRKVVILTEGGVSGGRWVLLSFIFDLLFPGNCLGCERNLREAEGPVRSIPGGWPESTFHFFNEHFHYNRFWKFRLDATVLCRECWLKLKPVTVRNMNVADGGFSVVSPFETNDMLLELIRFLKFRGGIPVSVPLGWWMADALNRFLESGEIALGGGLVLLPVPLHRRRMLQRGYNQAGLLSMEIGRFLGIPVLDDCLERVRNTAAQSKLADEDRDENVEGAFRLVSDPPSTVKTIVLVDDLYTTGATMRACLKALQYSTDSPIIILTAGRSHGSE
ncbi:MAG: ComF family protein [Bacteroidales bacterium]|nr:ComF family protein [Candidatus Latescibacterota bacterium]